MDFLDVLKPRSEEYCSGIYYPDWEGEENIYFEYKIVTEPSHSFGTVINNVLKDQHNIVLSTSWDIGFKVDGDVNKGFIALQDGTYAQINSIQKQDKVNKCSLYYLKDNPSTELILVCSQIDNPFERE